jgi:hypothetical protein
MHPSSRHTPNTYQELRSKFHAEPENYSILRGDLQAVRGRSNVWDQDYTLEKYIQSTDKMIGMLDGSISDRDIYDDDNKERSQQAPDTVIWLDKSARPVSWFVDAYWERFAKPEATRPVDEFLNIDRVNWFMRQGHSEHESESTLGPNDFDITRVPAEDIARIRAIFTEGEIDPEHWQESVWKLPTRLDNQNVLIIDEVKNKGGTLSIATQLLKRAIPTATVSGDYFWQAGAYGLGGSGDNLQMESAPVWYDSHDAWGRGVGDISKTYYEHLPDTAENRGRKLGWIALSAPHFDPRTFEILEDKKAKRLLQDIAFTTYDPIYRRPAADRSIEDIETILSEQGVTLADQKLYLKHRNEENKPQR